MIIIKDEKKLKSSLSLLSSQKFTGSFKNNGEIKKVWSIGLNGYLKNIEIRNEPIDNINHEKKNIVKNW